jgi:integrase
MIYSQNIAKKTSVIRKKWPKVRVHNQVSLSTGNMIISYVVDPRPRKREYFKDKQEALNRAHDLEIESHNLQIEPRSQLQTLDSGVANDLLKEHGVSLMEAAKYWLDQNSVEHKTVKEARNEWLEFKWAKVSKNPPELSEKTYVTLESTTKHFESAFSARKIHTISKEEFAKWVDNLPGGKVNQYNVRRNTMNLLNWCLKYGHIKNNLLTIHKVEGVKNRTDLVQILTIEECRDLLQVANGTCCYVYVLLSLFAGLRPEEASNAKWEWFEHGNLHVLKGKRGSHVVKLNPILWDKLMKLKKAKGRIVPKNFRIKLNEVQANAGWIPTQTLLNYSGVEKRKKWEGNTRTWIPDGLRHTYASYWIPIHHSFAELAVLMKNSEQILKSVYVLNKPES